jgi:hypothetical protein
MYAVRAAQVFDGTGFLAGGATVLVEEGRIAGVEPFGCDLLTTARSRRSRARCCPASSTPRCTWSPTAGPLRWTGWRAAPRRSWTRFGLAISPLGASGRLEAVLEQAVRMVLDGVATSDPSGH